MPKTEVILTHPVLGLGGESDQVKVAAGYARNYLFPQGLAIPLTGANKRRLDALKQRRAERESKELSTMTELADSLGKMTLSIAVKTGEDGKLFGSVTAGTISDELKHQFDVSLDKRKIHLPHPIKSLGEHEVELRLHQDLVTKLKVKLESTSAAVNEALKAQAQPKAGSQESGREQGAAQPVKTEKKGRRPAAAKGEEKPAAASKGDKAEAKGEAKTKVAKGKH